MNNPNDSIPRCHPRKEFVCKPQHSSVSIHCLTYLSIASHISPLPPISLHCLTYLSIASYISPLPHIPLHCLTYLSIASHISLSTAITLSTSTMQYPWRQLCACRAFHNSTCFWAPRLERPVDLLPATYKFSVHRCFSY